MRAKTTIRRGGNKQNPRFPLSTFPFPSINDHPLKYGFGSFSAPQTNKWNETFLFFQWIYTMTSWYKTTKIYNYPPLTPLQQPYHFIYKIEDFCVIQNDSFILKLFLLLVISKLKFVLKALSIPPYFIISIFLSSTYVSLRKTTVFVHVCTNETSPALP